MSSTASGVAQLYPRSDLNTASREIPIVDFGVQVESPATLPLLGRKPKNRGKVASRRLASEARAWHPFIAFEVDRELRPLQDDISAILELPDDFDGERSKSYSHTSISSALWTFVWFKFAYQSLFHEPIPLPHFQPGSSGRVNLHWSSRHHDLTVSVPETSDGELLVYGSDHRSDRLRLRGQLSQVSPETLAWLHGRWRVSTP